MGESPVLEKPQKVPFVVVQSLGSVWLFVTPPSPHGLYGPQGPSQPQQYSFRACGLTWPHSCSQGKVLKEKYLGISFGSESRPSPRGLPSLFAF